MSATNLGRLIAQFAIESRANPGSKSIDRMSQLSALQQDFVWNFQAQAKGGDTYSKGGSVIGHQITIGS